VKTKFWWEDFWVRGHSKETVMVHGENTSVGLLWRMQSRGASTPQAAATAGCAAQDDTVKLIPAVVRQACTKVLLH
jgi:hypothetical protein